VDANVLKTVRRFSPNWLYFGTLAQSNPHTKMALMRLVEHLPSTKLFYDVNLRTGHWTLELVEHLSSVAHVLKLSHHEAELLFQLTKGDSQYNLESFCRHWSSTYNIFTICVTLGSRGCAIFHEQTLRYFDGFAVEVVDTVGSGDAFAAAFLHGLNSGWTTEENAIFANALGALFASCAGATPDWNIEQCYALIRSRYTISKLLNPSASH
jgi:fructokinase